MYLFYTLHFPTLAHFSKLTFSFPYDSFHDSVYLCCFPYSLRLPSIHSYTCACTCTCTCTCFAFPPRRGTKAAAREPRRVKPSFKTDQDTFFLRWARSSLCGVPNPTGRGPRRRGEWDASSRWNNTYMKQTSICRQTWERLPRVEVQEQSLTTGIGQHH